MSTKANWQGKTEENLRFLKRVDALQLNLGLTRAAACRRIGVSEAMLSYIRQGKHTVSGKLWEKLVRAEGAAVKGREGLATETLAEGPGGFSPGDEADIRERLDRIEQKLDCLIGKVTRRG